MFGAGRLDTHRRGVRWGRLRRGHHSIGFGSSPGGLELCLKRNIYLLLAAQDVSELFGALPAAFLALLVEDVLLRTAFRADALLLEPVFVCARLATIVVRRIKTTESS